MHSAWGFPTSLHIGGTEYELRTDYRAVLDLLTALNDPDLTDEDERVEAYMKSQVMLQIMLPKYDELPPEHVQEALDKIAEFIDMGMSSDGKSHVKLMDWEQDAPVIIPAINKVLGKEVRAEKYMHWWTFLGAYMEIGESLFSNILNIRQKKVKHKKLEKWEQQYYKDNKQLIDLQKKYTEEELEEQKRLKTLFD